VSAGRVSFLCVVIGALAAALGCPEPEPEPEPAALVRADAWVRVTDPSVDAFAGLRPAAAVCADTGYYLDPLTMSFEVDTGLCDYLTVTQPTLTALAAGDTVAVELYHGQLAAPTPSQGYAGLALGGSIVWSIEVPIPGEAGTVTGRFTVEEALPAGAMVQMHIHNHGANSWDIVAVTARPGEGE
jgi:hypothetical protein